VIEYCTIELYIVHSLLEVYHDYVIDLLSIGTTLRTPLRVSEHPTTGPHVPGMLLKQNLLHSLSFCY